jgi:hypothetical protein
MKLRWMKLRWQVTWQTIYGWFRELARRFLFQTIHDVALMLDREQAGREANPSAAVIDKSVS